MSNDKNGGDDNVTPFTPRAAVPPAKPARNDNTPPGDPSDYEFAFRQPANGELAYLNYENVYLMPTQVGLAVITTDGALAGMVNYEYFVYARRVSDEELAEVAIVSEDTDGPEAA